MKGSRLHYSPQCLSIKMENRKVVSAGQSFEDQSCSEDHPALRPSSNGRELNVNFKCYTLFESTF